MSSVHVKLSFAVLILTLGTCVSVLFGQESSTMVEIDVYSGMPNPVFTLQSSELENVQRLFSLAKALPANSQTNVIRPMLGYRGLYIREVSKDNVVLSEMVIRNRELLVRRANETSRLQLPDNALERYILDRAAAKGGIASDLYNVIIQEIEKQ